MAKFEYIAPREDPGRLRFVKARAETLATEKLVGPAAEVLGRRVADVAGAEVMWPGPGPAGCRLLVGRGADHSLDAATDVGAAGGVEQVRAGRPITAAGTGTTNLEPTL